MVQLEAKRADLEKTRTAHAETLTAVEAIRAEANMPKGELPRSGAGVVSVNAINVVLGLA